MYKQCRESIYQRYNACSVAACSIEKLLLHQPVTSTINQKHSAGAWIAAAKELT